MYSFLMTGTEEWPAEARESLERAIAEYEANLTPSETLKWLEDIVSEEEEEN